jgi:hypothetical protein
MSFTLPVFQLKLITHSFKLLFNLQGRVNKLATNGSKTAVMDVMGFPCVSLGSSIVQLHDSLGIRCACACSEAGFSSQNGDCTEDCTIEEQHSVVRFLWEKGLDAKDIHKETFPVYGGKCSSCKAVHNWVEKFSQGRSKVADDA